MAGIYFYLSAIFFMDIFSLIQGCPSGDVAYKVVKSDIVLVGTVEDIIMGSDMIKFKTMCIYKGSDYNDVNIYGAGETAGCFSKNFTKGDEVILYLKKDNAGQLRIAFKTDIGDLSDELSVCGESAPKLATGFVSEPDLELQDLCPFYPDDCIPYVEATTEKIKIVKKTDPTTKPTEKTEKPPKPSPEEPGKTGGQEVKDDNGSSNLTFSCTLFISWLLFLSVIY